MKFQNLNIGKLAYEETNEIKRQLYEKPNKHAINNKSYIKHNFETTGGIIQQLHFESNYKSLISLSLNFKINSESLVNNFEIKIKVNNVMLESVIYDCAVLKSFNLNLNFFSYDKNLLEVEVFSQSQLVKFDYFETRLTGYITCENTNYSNIIIESNSNNNMIVLFYKKDNNYHKFEFANVESLINNFKPENNSATVVNNLMACAYNLQYSAGSYKNTELYLLKTDKINKNILITNSNGTMQTVISNNLNSLCSLQAFSGGGANLIYFEFNNSELTYKILNNALSVTGQKTKKINLKNSVKKLIPIYYKNTSVINNADVLFLNNKNELYLISSFNNSSDFEISENPVYIGSGEDAYAVFFDNKLHIFILLNNEVKHLIYQYYANSNSNKKISEKVVLNTKLGFISCQNIPFYLYNKNFDAEQHYD